MKTAHFIVFCAFVAAAFCQRSPYAGKMPVGYPVVETTPDPLGNRFGGSTEPLPVEALGDRDLVNRLAKLPVDKQPFWYINWKALEEQRKNQQTYDQRPNPFLDNSNLPQVGQIQPQPGQIQPQPGQNVQNQPQKQEIIQQGGVRVQRNQNLLWSQNGRRIQRL